MTAGTLNRAFDLYRRTAMSRSALVLLVANLIPLVGVLLFGWSLLTILVLYWIENGIVGIWNVPKILMAQGTVIPNLPDMPDDAALAATRNPNEAASLQAAWRQAREARRAMASTPGAGRLPGVGRAGLAIFFLFHYGFFWVGHGIFVLFALPQFVSMRSSDVATCGDLFPGVVPPPGFPPDFLSDCVSNPFGEVVWSNVLIAAAALFISHGASFLFNYVGKGEYLTASPTRQMGSPYARVVILHLTIIFGAMLVAFLGAPIGALIVLVALKTAFDLGLHLREHRNAGPVPATIAG